MTIGTISVERRSGGDRAWVRTANGWEDCEPPQRSPSAKDGDAEMWYPEPAAPPSEKVGGPS